MPKDYKSFCLVAAHLTRNAHRYYSPEEMEKMKQEQNNNKASESFSFENNDDHEITCKDVNHRLRTISNLK